MFDFHQLEQLVAIKEYKTLTKASEQLHISQPALTRSMQKLEENLQIELFTHKKNKLELNEIGLEACKMAEQLIAQKEQMVSALQKLYMNTCHYSIASCTPAPMWDLEPILHKVCPIATIESSTIDKDKLIPGLNQDVYDIVITPEEIEDDNYICIPYIEEDLYLSAPLSSEFASKEEISFAELDGQTMLLYSDIGFWAEMHKRTTPNTRFLIQPDRTAFTQIVESSTLLCFTSNLSMKREGLAKNRKAIPISDDQAHVTFFVVFKKENKSYLNDLIDYINNYYEY